MPQALSLAALADRLAAEQGPARRIVAVAGTPGSGKSTFAERLQALVDGRVPAQVLAMDGFHYDDLVLTARGHRPRKGRRTPSTSTGSRPPWPGSPPTIARWRCRSSTARSRSLAPAPGSSPRRRGW
jgi:hypothetical protein